MKKTIQNKRIRLGKRIRELRNIRDWTQQELGERADISYKFLGEVERGKQNPSFLVLEKIANALEIELTELFRFDHMILDRKKIENQINRILKTISDDDLRRVLLLLQIFYPLD